MTTTQLTTERIKLRLIAPADLQSIHTLHSLPETDEFNALGIPKDIDETKAIIAPWIAENKRIKIRNYTFAIEQNQDHKFIGLFGFKLGIEKYRRAEIWYKIHADYWRRGFAAESVNLILDYGFKTLKLHRIQAGCAVDNIGSIKVLEKAGMHRGRAWKTNITLKKWMV